MIWRLKIGTVIIGATVAEVKCSSQMLVVETSLNACNFAGLSFCRTNKKSIRSLLEEPWSMSDFWLKTLSSPLVRCKLTQSHSIWPSLWFFENDNWSVYYCPSNFSSTNKLAQKYYLIILSEILKNVLALLNHTAYIARVNCNFGVVAQNLFLASHIRSWPG